MFNRLTRNKDDWSCRINECFAEEWMYNHYGSYCDDPCKDCPFEKIINRLAEFEDAAAYMEDDFK